MTFSSTVMSSNVAGTWNVRPIPARACASAEERVTSMPSNSTRPVVGTVSPARQLKKVDLPAPLGQIRPMISPSATARSAPRTARKLPNALEMFSALSSMRTPHEPGRHALPPFVHAPGFEAREQDDDAAIEDVGQPRAAAAEPGIGCRLQRHQDQRADQRPEQCARAAQGGDDHHLHGNQDAEALHPARARVIEVAAVLGLEHLIDLVGVAAGLADVPGAAVDRALRDIADIGMNAGSENPASS